MPPVSQLSLESQLLIIDPVNDDSQLIRSDRLIVTIIAGFSFRQHLRSRTHCGKLPNLLPAVIEEGILTPEKVIVKDMGRIALPQARAIGSDTGFVRDKRDAVNTSLLVWADMYVDASFFISSENRSLSGDDCMTSMMALRSIGAFSFISALDFSK